MSELNSKIFWKPAPGFPLYEVSSNGSVRNIKTGKVLKVTVNYNGHLRYGLQDADHNTRSVFIARLVLRAFQGEPHDDKILGCHIDGNSFNNHISNLYWGSYLDNANDQARLGRQAIGSRHGRAKLDEEKVEVIRKRLLKGERGADIAREYCVDRALIYKIKYKEIWKHTATNSKGDA